MISVRILEPQIPETLKSDSSRLWQFPGNFVLARACNRSWRLSERHAYAIQDQYLPSIIPVRLILGWSPENKHRLFPYRNNTHRFWPNAELLNIYLRWMKHVKSGHWCAALGTRKEKLSTGHYQHGNLVWNQQWHLQSGWELIRRCPRNISVQLSAVSEMETLNAVLQKE